MKDCTILSGFQCIKRMTYPLIMLVVVATPYKKWIWHAHGVDKKIKET